MFKLLKNIARKNEYSALCDFAKHFDIPGPAFYKHVYDNIVTSGATKQYSLAYDHVQITPEYLDEYVNRVFEYILNEPC